MTAKNLSIPRKPDAEQWVHQADKAAPSEKMKRLTLDIPERLHRAIKVRAAEEGETIAQLLRSLFEERYG